MKKIESLVSNVIFFVLCLLIILLIGERYISIPVWLWPFGRMHPLLLHFPITLIVLLAILSIFQRHLEPRSFDKIQKFLLYLTACTTVFTALMGFFLSKEPGYVSDLMTLHKWIGIGVGFLVYGLMLTYHRKRVYNVLLSVSIIAIVFAGHLGAGLTHGMNFLIEPIITSKINEVTPHTPVYAGLIAPILENKCQGCHNPQKHKGGLDMSNLVNLYKGGEHGPIWQAGNAEKSELIVRALLPMDHEQHMPPKGKSQLTQEEVELISHWINNGVDTVVAMTNLNKSDTLYILASEMLAKKNESGLHREYNFDFASKKVIESLNNPYRSVAQITPSSPALSANIYVRQAYKKEFLNELNKIKDQIVFLNLANLPIEDEDLSMIARFKHLEKLNLNGTDISGKNLEVLSACTKLKSLSLGSTNIDLSMLGNISDFESLQELFIWNTGINHDGLQELKDQYQKIDFHLGYNSSDEPPLRLSPPILKNKSRVIGKQEKIVLEHKLKGASIRYTLDGSEPDSLSTELYTDPFEIANIVSIKTKAYKENWLPSDTKSYNFFVKGIKADSAILITEPNRDYKGRGGLSLIDHKKGNAYDFKTTLWLAYRKKPFKAVIDLGLNLKKIKEVVLCYGVNTQSYIMPPIKVSVYGGNQQDEMVFLHNVSPKQLTERRPPGEEVVTVPISEGNFRYYKIEAEPLATLPKWHDGKGKKAWLFVDEVFFY